MNDFTKQLQHKLGKKNLEKIQEVKIGIAGAGGLGSNCAFNLVRSGFKSFIIADFDQVETSNLNRQFYFANQVGKYKVDALEENLLAINSNLEIINYQLRLTSNNLGSIFAECDVIVEACDKASMKKLIAEKFIETDKLIVAASGLAGWGQGNRIETKQIKENFYLIGDLVTEVADNQPPISPRVNLAAAKQANVILNYILEG